MQPVQKVSIDGLRYAVDMIDRGADRLHLDLGAVCTRPESEPIPTSLFTACFADSWSKLAAFGQELRLTDLIRRVSTLITGLDQGLRRATVGSRAEGPTLLFRQTSPHHPTPHSGSLCTKNVVRMISITCSRDSSASTSNFRRS
jgi:hypothetical protein